MMFEFTTSPRILFGTDVRQQIADITVEYGSRILLVAGSHVERFQFLVDDFGKRGSSFLHVAITGEPSLDRITDGVAQARAFGADCVVAIGGGSAIDAGKAMAALLTNPGDPFEYLEVVGRGRPLDAAPLPVIAVPTTAGAGAEVTRNAVITLPEHRVKVSLRHRQMVPRVAIVDPLLTMSLPPEVTASTGLDALTQLIEPFVSNGSTPLTDGVCREAIPRAARSLVTACEEGTNLKAREDMALASLFGGIALANARLGAVHGFAGPIGGMYAAPHGMVCARLLPFVMQANVAELSHVEGGMETLDRFDEIGRMLTGRSNAKAKDAIDWVFRAVDRLGVPPLAHWEIGQEAVPEIVEKSRKASSMKGNPIELSEAVLTRIVTEALL